MVVSNECGTVSDTLIVHDGGCGYSIYAPSGFTPNNDGLNEYWQVFVNELERYEVQVFNRWGELVVQSTDPEDIWYGNHRGSNTFVPAGVYVWRITGQTLLKETVDEKGWVTVIR